MGHDGHLQAAKGPDVMLRCPDKAEGSVLIHFWDYSCSLPCTCTGHHSSCTLCFWCPD
jgi:hypothetical protein